MQRIKGFFQDFKVGTKLSVGIISIVVLVVAGSMVFVINSYRNNLIGSSKKLMEAELQLIAEKLDGELTDMAGLAVSLAASQESGGFGDREATLAMMKLYMERFPAIQGNYVNLEPNADGQDALYLQEKQYCINGRFVPYYQWPDSGTKEAFVLAPGGDFHQPWYMEPKAKAMAMAPGEKSTVDQYVTMTEPYYFEGVPLVSITCPIIINGEFKGVAGVDKSLVAYANELAQLKPYESANALLVSNSQALVASGAQSRAYIGQPITKLAGYGDDFFSIFKEKKGGIRRVYRRLDGEYAYYIYAVSPLTGWTIAMSVQEAEVLRPINIMITQIAIGAGIALLLTIGFILFLSNLLVVRPVNNIMALFGEIGMGNFSARATVSSQDELGVMAESLNAMLDNTLSLIQSREERDAIQDAVMKLLTEISDLTEGDLTVRAEVTDDMTGAIADSFNLMAEQIGVVVREVKTAAGRVNATSGEVQVATDKLAESSTLQATQIADAIEAINAMALTIRNVASSAVQSASVSEKSTVSAREGAEAVSKTNESMAAIRENVQETARAIKRLGEGSQEIGNIVQIIGDIADRTSILALNASIQAAMAGDAGRGFAVVAEEVQRLAERSTNSTKQIDTLVKSIQSEITEAGASMDESIQRVVEGSQRAVDAHSKLEDIEAVSGQLAVLIGSITELSEAQATESEKITQAMEEIGTISSDTSSTSQATASKMNEMEETALTMMASIASFKVD